MKEFYDGKRRPLLTGFEWTKKELNRICLNCGYRFGRHIKYDCPEPDPEDL